MPCDTSYEDEEQTSDERKSQVEQALDRLEKQLASGNVKVAIDRVTGAVAFANWKDRDRITDVCAYRRLTAKNSWELRKALAKAEQVAGRKVNTVAVAAGTHSHDGGHTWHKGH